GTRLARALEPATGFTLVVSAGGRPPVRGITLSRVASLRRLGPEGYTLDVSASGVRIRAPQAAGLFYGTQTMLQLLPPAIYRAAPTEQRVWRIPAVAIEDAPRFSWRGAHLDVARHFLPKEFVKKYIDLLALHKLNTFHWHLTDDQGWRIEIVKYPRLTSVGAWRQETLVGGQEGDSTTWRYDALRHGGFYTQSDVREIVAYAAARFVTIVPEIEMPGHAVAAIAAYPALGVTGNGMEVATRWGVFSDILNADSSTVAFMQDVLGEVMTLFPGRFIHIGGDEADKTKWKASPKTLSRVRDLGREDEHELQSWFVRQMDAFLTAHGRRLVGWDEILEGGLAPNATVMSWRGTTGGIDAARAGHDVVMAPQRPTYFDHYQAVDRAREPFAIGGYNPIDSVYAWEPVPAELDSLAARHVLGAQAQLWTEYIATPKSAEYMAYPRLSALAEVLWSPRALRDPRDFTSRLAAHLRRLDALDVNYRR
ncbi:MAG: beta-N-acetylhexosaminidase, partial [Gemmatimonadaceae bacterium]